MQGRRAAWQWVLLHGLQQGCCIMAACTCVPLCDGSVCVTTTPPHNTPQYNTKSPTRHVMTNATQHNSPLPPPSHARWHFQVKEAAMVAWAMAKQGVTHPGLMPALAEVAQEHGKHLKPASISMLAYALGKQGVRDEALLALLCQQALQHLGAFTDHGLGIMLRALRTLDYRHEELLRAVAGGIAEEEAVKVRCGCVGWALTSNPLAIAMLAPRVVMT